MLLPSRASHGKLGPYRCTQARQPVFCPPAAAATNRSSATLCNAAVQLGISNECDPLQGERAFLCYMHIQVVSGQGHTSTFVFDCSRQSSCRQLTLDLKASYHLSFQQRLLSHGVSVSTCSGTLQNQGRDNPYLFVQPL